MTTTANETGIPTQLGHVALRVHDVDRSIEFYTDVVTVYQDAPAS